MERQVNLREANPQENPLIAEHFYQLWRDNDVPTSSIRPDCHITVTCDRTVLSGNVESVRSTILCFLTQRVTGVFAKGRRVCGYAIHARLGRHWRRDWR